MDATITQAQLILRYFQNLSSEKLKELIDSGLLEDIRDCKKMHEIDRDEFRKSLKLDPLHIRVLTHDSIMVNLDAPLHLPHTDYYVDLQTDTAGRGWVTIERRQDGLYANDRKIILFRGNEFCIDFHRDILSKPVLHPNIIDALMKHKHLIPDDWKKDTEGRSRRIFFWGVIFRHDYTDFCGKEKGFSAGRYLLFWKEDWRSNHAELDGTVTNSYAAILEP